MTRIYPVNFVRDPPLRGNYIGNIRIFFSFGGLKPPPLNRSRSNLAGRSGPTFCMVKNPEIGPWVNEIPAELPAADPAGKKYNNNRLSTLLTIYRVSTKCRRFWNDNNVSLTVFYNICIVEIAYCTFFTRFAFVALHTFADEFAKSINFATRPTVLTRFNVAFPFCRLYTQSFNQSINDFYDAWLNTHSQS